MTEKTAKDALRFLCDKYGMNYTFAEFENYLGTNISIETYSYHNENGCFTITNFAARGEVEYLHFNSVGLLKNYLFSEYLGDWNLNNDKLRKYYDEKLSHKIRIFEYEPEIWKKHKVKTFFGGYKKELNILAEVIQTQIDKHSEFFGIKV